MERNAVESGTEATAVLRERFQLALERLRMGNGLKRGPFADRLDIPRTTYSYLMSPAANSCLQTLAHIARAMEIDPLTLLGEGARVAKEAPDAPASNGRA